MFLYFWGLVTYRMAKEMTWMVKRYKISKFKRCPFHCLLPLLVIFWSFFACSDKLWQVISWHQFCKKHSLPNIEICMFKLEHLIFWQTPYPLNMRWKISNPWILLSWSKMVLNLLGAGVQNILAENTNWSQNVIWS